MFKRFNFLLFINSFLFFTQNSYAESSNSILRMTTVSNLVVNDSNNKPLIWLGPGGNEGDYDFSFAGKEQNFIGGFDKKNGLKASQSLYISGRPYSGYHMGCTLCVVTTEDPFSQGGGQPAISQTLSGIPSDMYGSGVDQVGFFEYINNTAARIIADVDHYENDRVVFKTPLTQDQMSQIHPFMIIQTNTLAPNISEKSKEGELPSLRNYSGYVSNASDAITQNYIKVMNWFVVGEKDTFGKVPDAGNKDALERWYSNYGKPVVFIGQPTKSFGRNLVMKYKGGGTNAKSLIHSFEGEELDMMISDEYRPHSISMHGMTIGAISYTNSLEGTDIFTNDSWDLKLAGEVPEHLLIDEGSTNNVINSNSLYVHSFEGVAGKGKSIGNHLLSQKRIGWEYDQFSDKSDQTGAGNRFRLVNYLSKDTAANNWSGTSMHLSLLIDGNESDIESGVNEGEIIWNQQGQNNGGISLCGGSGVCGLVEKYDGSIILNSTYLKKGAVLSFQGNDNSDGITINRTDDNNLLFKSNISNTKIGLRGLDSITFNATTYDDRIEKVTGQGAVLGWNNSKADYKSYFVNISPSTNSNLGGFKFYNVLSGTTIRDVAPIFEISSTGSVTTNNVLVKGDIILVNSGGLKIISPGTAISDDNPVVTADARDSIIFKTASGRGITITSNQIKAIDSINAGNKLIIKAVTYSQLEKNQLLQGTQQYCSDCYSSANSHHKKGIPVWWDGSNWTDSLGEVIQH
ncbi:hypothetical protein [Entomobacter blattae]|uniref:Autotransporter domain-containing protein n=1 Tax=Entomobacter blattae TaxID=2762277 RepID=A0A7H1NQA7_9PROT|nr:hypothetical protein [Entomobacter blattae]QNT77967.1 hypothetical protein JGUZn3_07320 [Entomobacter blattae]